MKPKQTQTGYHAIMDAINDLINYQEVNPAELKVLIKKLHDEHQFLKLLAAVNGSFGIRYKTSEELSMHADSNTIFFSTETERDNIYDDWKNNLYWDEAFNDVLFYRTPNPNCHDIEKIYRGENDEIYTLPDTNQLMPEEPKNDDSIKNKNLL